jgi:hypothetical protein
MTILLGYADFVSKSDKWTKKHHGLAWLIINLAGVLLFAMMGGLGTRWEDKTANMLWVVHLLDVFMFLIFFGRGNPVRGFNKIVALFSSIPQRLDAFSKKISDNLFPFIVNIAICILLISLLKIAIVLMFGIPLVGGLLRIIPFVADDTSNSVFKAFFYQVWVLPYILAYSAIAIDWAFFVGQNEDDDV